MTYLDLIHAHRDLCMWLGIWRTTFGKPMHAHARAEVDYYVRKLRRIRDVLRHA